ncbi:MAG: YigZ family protein [Bacteroidales bacterium]|nr:YigZ family protein [Bacteroidales bacterium]
MADDTYLTIEAPAEGLYRERGSRFMAFAFPVGTEPQVKAHIAALRARYHDARHHCYAYVMGPMGERWRVNDDGEPSGTAGRPIHGQLQSQGLTDILVVVVRYFGGTKLGVPGLINAYRTATAEALSRARVVRRTVDDLYHLSFGYQATNEVMRLVKEMALEMEWQRFDTQCAIGLRVRMGLRPQVLPRLQRIEGLHIDLNPHHIDTQHVHS